jgi:hypothetical protein
MHFLNYSFSDFLWFLFYFWVLRVLFYFWVLNHLYIESIILILFQVHFIAVLLHWLLSTRIMVIFSTNSSKTICLDISQFALRCVDSLMFVFGLFGTVPFRGLILNLVWDLLDRSVDCCWIVAVSTQCSLCSSPIPLIIQIHASSQFALIYLLLFFYY